LTNKIIEVKWGKKASEKDCYIIPSYSCRITHAFSNLSKKCVKINKSYSAQVCYRFVQMLLSTHEQFQGCNGKAESAVKFNF